MEYPGEADIPLCGSPETVISVGEAIFGDIINGGIALFTAYIFRVHEMIGSEPFPSQYGYNRDSKKSHYPCPRQKPPLPSATKARLKPGPKPKNGCRTVAHFEKDECRQDLTYHDWIQVFNHMEEHELLQQQVVAYFATHPEFQFSKKEAWDAVTFFQKIAHHQPDLDVAFPLA
ncbi:hypothetical protein K438DRAFT_1762267 [Mycena galopus ATCC 62051]|nr:hypothetical protein K438DRAFT_1762267 [Mycena galopus ATCC 62051]